MVNHNGERAMQSTDSETGGVGPVKRPQRLTILEMMILIAGVAVGLWLFGKNISEGGDPWHIRWVLAVVAVLGGFSVVGVPLLLLELRRRRSRWGAGKVMWFSQGMASWLLWPPMIYLRIRKGDAMEMSGTCYFYGTPLMAIYVTCALLAGGWLRRGSTNEMLCCARHDNNAYSSNEPTRRNRLFLTLFFCG